MKDKITKKQFNRLVESNFASGFTLMLIEHLEFLRGEYKMKEKQILNNSLKQLNTMLERTKFTENQKEHLMSLTDALHNEVYEVKKEYRKQISKHFIIEE